LANEHDLSQLHPPPYSKPILKEFSYIVVLVVAPVLVVIIMMIKEVNVEFLGTTASNSPILPVSKRQHW
jgi:hypothetical protein